MTRTFPGQGDRRAAKDAGQRQQAGHPFSMGNNACSARSLTATRSAASDGPARARSVGVDVRPNSGSGHAGWRRSAPRGVLQAAVQEAGADVHHCACGRCNASIEVSWSGGRRSARCACRSTPTPLAEFHCSTTCGPRGSRGAAPQRAGSRGQRRCGRRDRAPPRRRWSAARQATCGSCARCDAPRPLILGVRHSGGLVWSSAWLVLVILRSSVTAGRAPTRT